MICYGADVVQTAGDARNRGRRPRAISRSLAQESPLQLQQHAQWRSVLTNPSARERRQHPALRMRDRIEADGTMLIHKQTVGAQGRLAGWPLLVQERSWWDWASPWLREGEHYLGVRTDLSNLHPTLDWLDARGRWLRRL